MTISDAQSLLYVYFQNNDYFYWPDDRSKVLPISETPEEDKCALEAALNLFVETKLLTKTGFIKQEKSNIKTINCGLLFILNKSFTSYPQNIELKPSTCVFISTLINKFSDLVQSKTITSDAHNIQEKDILALLEIIRVLTDLRNKEE